MSGPLGEARADAAARITALEAQLAGIVDTASASSGDDEHDPEGQTIAFDRAQVAALLAAARHDLAEIDAALARVDDGTYGVCAVCGRPIAAERLEARPAARTYGGQGRLNGGPPTARTGRSPAASR